MPVWHERTAKWVKDGKLVLLGVTQEQHRDRCRLLAQWKGFQWPILHDPINVLRHSAVPIFVAIDEHGIVRDTRPSLDDFETDFLTKTFADDAADDARGAATDKPTPELPKSDDLPDFQALRERAESEQTASAWRALGDASTLWGQDDRSIDAALDAYEQAIALAPSDGALQFRLGVCHRRRYDSAGRRPGDFQAAIDHWGRALELEPNQYIYRRRIEQFGPRLDKPYSFYDWVDEAERAIRDRGEQPITLDVRPRGAELAFPIRSFEQKPVEAREPDPEGKIFRDDQGLVAAEITVAPARVAPGKAVRVHIELRLDAEKTAHWNNEAEAPRLWIVPAEDWQVEERLLTVGNGRGAVDDKPRIFEFEAKAPAQAKGEARFAAYALYHVCDENGGQCRYLRLDIPIDMTVAEPKAAPGGLRE